MSDAKAKRLTNDGCFITIPSLMTQAVASGIDASLDSISVYDASAGENVNIPVGLFFTVQPTTGAVFSVASVTAAGTGMTTAASCGAFFNFVASGATGAGVQLLTPTAGMTQIVKNGNANTALLVYPGATGMTINATTATAGYSLPPSTDACFITFDATHVYTLPFVAS